MKRKMPRNIPFDHLGEWKKISSMNTETPAEKVAAICKLVNYPLANNVRVGVFNNGENDNIVSIAQPETKGGMASVFIPSSVAQDLDADALGGLLLVTAKRTETEKDEDRYEVNKFMQSQAKKAGGETCTAKRFAGHVHDALENAKAREDIEAKGWKFGGYFNALAEKYFGQLEGKDEAANDKNSWKVEVTTKAHIEPLLAAIQTGDPSFIDNCFASPEFKAAMEKALLEAQKTQKSTSERTKNIISIIDKYIENPPPKQKQDKQDQQKGGEDDKNDKGKGEDQKDGQGKDKQEKSEGQPRQQGKREIADPKVNLKVMQDLSESQNANRKMQSTFVNVKDAGRTEVIPTIPIHLVEAGPAQEAIFERDQTANSIAEAVAGRILRAKKSLRHFVHGTNSGDLDDLSLPNYPLSDRPNIWMEDHSHRIKKGKFKVALLLDISGSMRNDYHDVASMATGISAGLRSQGISTDCFAFTNDFYILESPLAIYKYDAFKFSGTPLCDGIVNSKNCLDQKYGLDAGAKDRFFFVITDGEPNAHSSDVAILSGAGLSTIRDFDVDAINSSKAALNTLAGSGWTSFGFGYGMGLEPKMLSDIFGENNIVMKELDPEIIAATISDVVASRIYRNAQELSAEDGVKI